MTETTGTRITFNLTGIDEVIEEKENQFTALREVEWGDRPSSLEIRRWRKMPNGDEFPLKGMTFMTPEGPNNLAETLVAVGFGNTKDILASLKDRDNFRKCLNSVLGKEDENYDKSAGEEYDDYYDPSELMKL